MKSLITFAFLFVACGLSEGSVGDDGSTTTTDGQSLSAAKTVLVLNLVNYPGTDATVLTATGIDPRAVQHIIKVRNGADGVTPSTDDVFFASLPQLDSVSYVTSTVLNKLSAYATEHPAPAGETVKGVAFHGWEDEAVIWGVNQASSADLDAMLDTRAATSLLTHRPFTTVGQMGTLSYVGATALNALRGGALNWWSLKHGGSNGNTGSGGPLAGRFDGAVFNETEAETALQIVNQATLAQLTAHSITSTAAKAIIAARPLMTLTQVAAVSGVGPATMNALLAYAQSGTWGVSCEDTFTAAVGPQLANLLFMSESDRPIDLVLFTGAGTSAPTAASVLTLVNAPAGYTAETRDPANYYVDFEPSSATADMGAAAAVQAAITAQLTDVVYIAIHPPAGSVNQSEVGVYLLGRTRCGDIVGLHAISIET
jgi:DNA uptake protein ComE-like DNA-binding protein